MNLLLTGATGFLGRRLAEALQSRSELKLTAVVRRRVEILGARIVEVRGLDADTDWSTALTNQQVVIHSAARAHIMKDAVADPLAEYRRVNVDGTLNLARQAAQAGVKRFIFVSSVKVNGEHTGDKPFGHLDLPAFQDPYGQSKFEAEQGLREIAGQTGTEVVVIRPPLVYGPGVKGNFKSLLALTMRRLPLPLGAIQNRRSLVALDNLIDLIITCIDHPAAANQTFLVSDDQDLSTTQLLRLLGQAAGKPARLIPVSSRVLQPCARLIGKKSVADRLLGNLQVDVTHTKETLGWTPPISVEEGLRRCFEPTDKT